MGTLAAPVTIDEFLTMESAPEVRQELIDGVVVEMGSGGSQHELIKAEVLESLAEHNLQNRKGKLFSESTFVLSGDALMRDIAYVSRERLNAVLSGRMLQGAPDVAIEVVSSESAETLERKTQLYLANGAKSVWALYPTTKSVLIRRASGETLHLDSADTLEEPAIPGFKVAVADLFRIK